MNVRDTGRRRDSLAPATAIGGGGFLIALGVWAMVSPRTFFDTIAVFPPYNQHFLQDVGAFQIGLGAVLLLAVARPLDALAVALVGVGIGSAAHTVSHVIGRELGGRPQTDIPMFTVFTVLLLAAGAGVWRRGAA